MSERLYHTIPPLYDQNSRVLLLGSFPSPKSREIQFFYGHPQNRFWRVLSAVLEEELPETTQQKREMCLRNGIALWDTVRTCQIQGASDSSIRQAEPNDIGMLLLQSNIERIFTTGTKSGALYRKFIAPVVGRSAVTLPSTSPANAAWSLDRLIEAYRVIL